MPKTKYHKLLFLEETPRLTDNNRKACNGKCCLQLNFTW